MNFSSDNWAGAAPQIIDALAQEAGHYGSAYGTSDTDARVERRFCEVFEQDVALFLVGTGTAANGLALAAVSRPGGIVLCHTDSHIEIDECGGIALQADGARLRLIAGENGRMRPEDLAAAIEDFPHGKVHAGQLSAVSLTQVTEAGTVYAIDHIRALSDIAHEHGLAVHMDGARFANALVHLDLTPAEMTWKAGIDLLSFGGTKNGCISAEALVVFNSDHAAQLPYLRMRAGHLFSKSRFLAAQFDAYLADDLWLGLAGNANAMADRLRAGLQASNRARLAWPTPANEVFAIFSTQTAEQLRAAGATFYEWNFSGKAALGLSDGEDVFRLIASFATSAEDVDRFLDALAG
jgi:threonine aldolase